MSITDRTVFLAVSAIAMASAPALAFFGAPGCTNLPLYNRALGALQGMTSACDMTIDEAVEFFAAVPSIREKFATLQRVDQPAA